MAPGIAFPFADWVNVPHSLTSCLHVFGLGRHMPCSTIDSMKVKSKDLKAPAWWSSAFSQCHQQVLYVVCYPHRLSWNVANAPIRYPSPHITLHIESLNGLAFRQFTTHIRIQTLRNLFLIFLRPPNRQKSMIMCSADRITFDWSQIKIVSWQRSWCQVYLHGHIFYVTAVV